MPVFGLLTDGRTDGRWREEDREEEMGRGREGDLASSPASPLSILQIGGTTSI